MSTSEQLKGWTPDRVEKLRELWDQGLSASMIANRLGGCSRNAVIGKMHRLRLPRRTTSVRIRASTPRSWTVPRRVSRPHTKPRKIKIVDLRLKAIAVVQPPIQPVVCRTGKPVELLDLQPHHCRYPVTSELPHLFCAMNRGAGSSYCDTHHFRCTARTLPSRRPL